MKYYILGSIVSIFLLGCKIQDSNVETKDTTSVKQVDSLKVDTLIKK